MIKTKEENIVFFLLNLHFWPEKNVKKNSETCLTGDRGGLSAQVLLVTYLYFEVEILKIKPENAMRLRDSLIMINHDLNCAV